MPFFKTTKNIFVDFAEHFDPNWMDSDKLKLPPKTEWDYKREMTIDDVDFWETIFESTGCAVYAAYSPYAEFYLIKTPPKGHLLIGQWAPFETYYGQGAMHRVIRRMKELEMPTHLTKYWVDPEDMWLYQPSASN
jgi:hypothetical protein